MALGLVVFAIVVALGTIHPASPLERSRMVEQVEAPGGRSTRISFRGIANRDHHLSLHHFFTSGQAGRDDQRLRRRD